MFGDQFKGSDGSYAAQGSYSSYDHSGQLSFWGLVATTAISTAATVVVIELIDNMLNKGSAVIYTP